MSVAFFFRHTDPGHSDVPKGPLQKYLRTARSRKKRKAKRHKQSPLRRASGKGQKCPKARTEGRQASKQARTKAHGTRLRTKRFGV
eukprot:1157373-Pelagomonas_calceolata.AAC.6